jgi:hypothetical protein
MTTKDDKNIMLLRRILLALTASVLLAVAAPAFAAASTLTVDDDKADCPSAGFTSLQAAINQAAPWDTVVVCPGTYREVSNAPTSTNSPAQSGSRNGFLITKPLTIKGAGADKVFIEAAGAAGSSLAGTAPYLRDGGGAVIQINRQSLGSSDMTENFVDISGVTVRSPNVYAEAGIAFFNTSGRISNSVIGPMYRAADATELAARPHGWGVVMANSLQGASEATVRREVTVANSLVTGYQEGGVLFDDSRGTDGNATTQARSGIVEYGTVTGSRIVGSGPSDLVAQTGVQYHAGARGSVSGSEVVGNMYTPDPRRSIGVLLTDATTGADPSNLPVRAFSATGNVLSGNGYGLFNADITNTAVRLGAPALATGSSASAENWYGCAAGPVLGAASQGGCDGISGADSAAAPSVEIGNAARTTAPAPLTAPAATSDAAPTGSIVDPAEGASVAVGQAITPTVVAHDDFGVKSVALSVDGNVIATDAKAPYEFSWTPGYADLGAQHTLTAVITDSAGQTTTTTSHVTVPVPAGYAAATITPDAWNAGTVLVGQDTTKVFTFKNTGQNPVAIATVVLSGDTTFSRVAADGACAGGQTLAIGESCTITVRYAPTAEGAQAAALAIGYVAPGATSPIVVPITAVGHVFNVTAQADVSGTVPSTLALNVSGPAPSLGTFVPGRAMDYTTALTVGVTSSGGNAALTVQDPSGTATGHLVNGAFTLAAALQAKAGAGTFAPVGSAASPLTLASYGGPVANEPVGVTFKQSIGATEALRTGTYNKTVVLTLSTTAP